MLVHHLDKNTAKDNDAFRNSEWGPEAAEQMCKQIGHLPVPGGNGKLTMKDLIDRTPKDLISKVMLEEKLFDTWYYRRTVLLGDGELTYQILISYAFNITTYTNILLFLCNLSVCLACHKV